MGSNLVPYVPNSWRLALGSLMLLWLGSVWFGAWLLFGPDSVLVKGSVLLALLLAMPLLNWIAYVCGAELVTPAEARRRAKSGGLPSRQGRFLLTFVGWSGGYFVTFMINSGPSTISAAVIALVVALAAGFLVSCLITLAFKDTEEDEAKGAPSDDTPVPFLRTVLIVAAVGAGFGAIFTVLQFLFGVVPTPLELAEHIGAATAIGGAFGAFIWAANIAREWTPGLRK